MAVEATRGAPEQPTDVQGLKCWPRMQVLDMDKRVSGERESVEDLGHDRRCLSEREPLAGLT